MYRIVPDEPVFDKFRAIPETKTITLYFLITDEEFKNETLAIDFHIYGSPDRGTLAIIHEPEAN